MTAYAFNSSAHGLNANGISTDYVIATVGPLIGIGNLAYIAPIEEKPDIMSGIRVIF